jgi:hypothetical protein
MASVHARNHGADGIETQFPANGASAAALAIFFCSWAMPARPEPLSGRSISSRPEQHVQELRGGPVTRFHRASPASTPCRDLFRALFPAEGLAKRQRPTHSRATLFCEDMPDGQHRALPNCAERADFWEDGVTPTAPI